MNTKPDLDLITIGRSSVDLYGDQVGGRLEDMGSFSKYIGGSPTNIAAGTARLGLKSAVITRVGDEHMGRYIREQLVREGVDVSAVITDPDRLTALVLLGIRDEAQFPLIFYRENCADMALCEDDIDPDFIARGACVCATGTHLSNPRTEAAVLKALNLARDHDGKTALDIDYRPNLWGLSGHGDGENRFIQSGEVTRKLQATLHLFDLIVGTEEEFHIAGGSTDTLAALLAVRERTSATLVCKRGPMGAVAFTGPIGENLDDGVSGPGFAIEVFNVLGAGDGFMSGLLRGWLRGEDWRTSLTWANACGALAVSRHGCTPAYPSWEELQYFIDTPITTPALRHDRALEQIHWATNRNGEWPELKVFAFDHRSQLEAMAEEAGAPHQRIADFKQLCLKATMAVCDDETGQTQNHGILCDGRLGRDALYRAAGTGLWIGRPVEKPGSRPLRFEPELGPDLSALREWPLDQVVKVLCFAHPDDEDELWLEQLGSLTALFAATRRNRQEFLLEVVSSKQGVMAETTTADVIKRIYGHGIYPDWWKLEPQKSDLAWQNICAAITDHDPHTRGILVLGLDAPLDQMNESLSLAASQELVKGFAVGRTIFGDVARDWFAGKANDEDAVITMTENYRRLCNIWDRARKPLGGKKWPQSA